MVASPEHAKTTRVRGLRFCRHYWVVVALVGIPCA